MAKEQPKIFWDEGEDPNKAPGLPIFRWAPYERKDLVHGNSWIVMGKDRPAGRDSGHSYQETHNYAIDIVVGRSGLNVNKVDPQFKTDSARIYISQKTDIDTFEEGKIKFTHDFSMKKVTPNVPNNRPECKSTIILS